MFLSFFTNKSFGYWDSAGGCTSILLTYLGVCSVLPSDSANVRRELKSAPCDWLRMKDM